MSQAISSAPDGSLDEIYDHVTNDLAEVLDRKRSDVAWKLKSVRTQFEEKVREGLARRRENVTE
jgi:hypothetical protein